ncbi:MAG TPA: DUF6526 family protein [Bacteroidia bacterium]|jgi:hypothetical protein|nr:DUF6526 family protein [Bacteroidia bacterium]
MKNQNYHNHIRWYIPHHFIFYPILSVAILFSAYCSFHYAENRLVWIAITSLFILLGWLSFMLRQHYALGNQNRAVRLELRLRYYMLTHKSFEKIEHHLSFGQIAALRFAPDEELVALITRTIQDNLCPDEIKKSIKNWLPDYMRL